MSCENPANVSRKRTTPPRPSVIDVFDESIQLPAAHGFNFVGPDVTAAYNAVTDLWDVTSVGAAGTTGWTRDAGTPAVRLTFAADPVGIGTATPAAGRKVHVLTTGALQGIRVEGGATSDNALDGLVTGDLQARFALSVAGAHAWGDGVVVQDTRLRRVAVGTLALDDPAAGPVVLETIGTSGFQNRILVTDVQPRMALAPASLAFGAGGVIAPDILVGRGLVGGVAHWQMSGGNILDAIAAGSFENRALTADAQPRSALRFDQLLFGAGGAAVPDVRWQRTAGETIVLDDNTGTDLVQVTIRTAKFTVTGAIDPTSLSLSDPAAGTALFLDSADGQTALVSAVAHGRIRYNNALTRWEVSENGGAYVGILSSAGPWDRVAPVTFLDFSTDRVVLGGAAGDVATRKLIIPTTGADQGIRATNLAAGENVLDARIAGEANDLFQTTTSAILWGPGGAIALDTQIGRGGADLLEVATGDTFRIVSGGFRTGATTVAATPYAVLATDLVLMMTVGGTVNLPSLAAAGADRHLWVRKAPGLVGIVVLDPSGAETIDALVTLAMASMGAHVHIYGQAGTTDWRVTA